ncbi:pyridoxal phosphate-dependent aminotransferase [Dactylosporangium sp. CA-092794]|uniref:pyridoxal phosphate-dependent aminotransferase n=1 Tax=Dactylosporangium sp. CA-092794 TaxID=3239929 RepID=UPI003D900168
MSRHAGISPNLALDQEIAKRRAAGEDIVHLGFGESRLPVHPSLVEQLAKGAYRHEYGPVAGSPDVREAAAGYFTRRRLATLPEQIIVAPGSKPLLAALVAAIGGDVILPNPCWVTYAPQARLFGHKPYLVPVPERCGGVPEASALQDTIRRARAEGGDPRVLIVTLPDNPTGTLAPPEMIRELCRIAEDERLIIVSDEIYRDTLHAPADPMASPAEFLPDRTVVVTGLSKSLALGGWRIGLARFPAGAPGQDLHAGVAAVASETWSTLAGPMQQVAAYALNESEDIRQHLAQSAFLHGAVAADVHRIMTYAGARGNAPQGAFYVYPDFEPIRAELAGIGVRDSPGLQRYLLDEFGIAVLGGHHFGEAVSCLRFRAATSLLYGETDEQRWRALTSADPLRVPHVARTLDRIELAFHELARRAKF